MKWFLIFFLLPSMVMAQQSADELPYQDIGSYPDDYGPGNVLSRMVDGLGYRYYWASEGLSTSDLDYKIDESARSLRQTLEHIHSLCWGISCTARGVPITRQPTADLSYEELRESTLRNLEVASSQFRGKSDDELARLAVIFPSSGGNRDFPLWHLMNGQLSDALYHVGQVVSFRRASGNPMDPKVNVFMGRNNE